MDDYTAMLEEGFAETNSFGGGEPCSRLAFLGDYIFDFTTYDSAMSGLFASKALEVCEAINEKTTFDYIDDAVNYQWYLLMCNMPFFASRLNWGTSIRGAWWDLSNPEAADFTTSGLFRNGEQITWLKFTDEAWGEFIAALIAFGRVSLPADTQG